MFDIIALGELLIDFTPAGQSEDGKTLFEMNPGGAPANLLAAASRLGSRTAFIGKVGKDMFGSFLEKTLNENSIDTSHLRFSRTVNTTLAFVQLSGSGERSFSFYRDPGADLMLEKSEIEASFIKQGRIFHFGSLSMTSEPARSATVKAAEAAKKSGVIISYDPNLRPMLWRSLVSAKEMMIRGLQYADIIKVSDDEMEFLTSESDPSKGSALLSRAGASLVFVTAGPKGAFYRAGAVTGHVPSYDVDPVDTTGAGDAFFGALLHRLKDHSRTGLGSLSADELEDMTAFANAAGAVSTMKKGAIPSMPSPDEIDTCMKSMKKTVS